MNFIADDMTAPRLGLGATVNFAAFGAAFGAAGRKTIPAGTVVCLAESGIEPFVAGLPAYITVGAVSQTGAYAGSDTAGLYAGGVFYEDRLPDAVNGELSAEMKTALGETFTFQDSRGVQPTIG